ncbi:MAG TPA: GGDEF domain-containing protein [Candidatus Dormibacteraeota bacterium]|nr:GGDEF domain-containing protein [Candidatus Dormibacteraeota bacterium]
MRVKNAEITGQLRAAALEGDEARIARLLSELLRFQGLTKGQRVSWQLHALLNLVQSLRGAALTDELTGLYNRRGFLQIGTRLLDVAARDARGAHLVYFDINGLEHINASMGRSAGDVMLRQLGNLMRDLYPNYGVYEVLGRLRGEEFAALTTSAEYASRSAILLRTRRPHTASYDLPQLSLSIGVAHFNPQRPVGIDELLQNAEQAMHEHKRVSQIASSELTPHPV